MPGQPSVTDEIFPQHSGKSYALVETMRGEGPLVGKGPDDTVFAFPIVLLIEGLLLLGVTLVIFLFSLLKQAPLDTIANPLITVDPAKAPWYFIGLQELLEHMHPLVAGVILPSVLVAFLVALPYLDRARAGTGVWFTSARGKRIAGWTALYTAVAMTALIALDNAFNLRETLRGRAPQWLAQGLLPAAILLAVVAVPPLVVWLAARRSSVPASMRELMLALFTVMFVSAVVFTLSGFLFRGPGFKMYWPWQMPNGYNPWDGL
jgi:menaquinol-cytochrome c reductase cytochrome b/c subunit